MSELICGDSMKILPALAEHLKPSFKMIFLDPPFFEWQDEHEGKPNHDQLSKLTFQLLQHNGIVWLCGTQPQLTEDWRHWSRFFRVVFEIVQYKHTGTPPINKYQPIRVHENIWCLIRQEQPLFKTNLDLDKVTTRGRLIQKKAAEGKEPMKIRYGKSWVEWRTDVGFPKSVWECTQIKQGSKEYVGHPTQKPRRLIELLIRMSTEEGDWILDPFAGSGTTLVEAEANNRRCLAVEIKKEYCKMIKERQKKLKMISKLSQFIR